MEDIDDIKEKVKEKLIQYELDSFEELDDKTLKRLCEIELCISEMEANSKELEKKLKATIPNITRIISSDKVSITKKTAYNNPIIIKYIELSKNDFPDIFNEEKIKRLEKNYIELSEIYNKVIDNIIDNYNEENEKKLLLSEVENLKKEVNNLKDIINEKNKELSFYNNKNNKVIRMKK